MTHHLLYLRSVLVPIYTKHSVVFSGLIEAKLLNMGLLFTVWVVPWASYVLHVLNIITCSHTLLDAGWGCLCLCGWNPEWASLRWQFVPKYMGLLFNISAGYLICNHFWLENSLLMQSAACFLSGLRHLFSLLGWLKQTRGQVLELTSLEICMSIWCVSWNKSFLLCGNGAWYLLQEVYEQDTQ